MTKIFANIASIPERVEFLKKTVESLYNQVDVINLYLNNYTHNPFENDPKINVVFGDNSKGDAGKFFFVKKCDGYYLTCDDDLIYPKNYVSDMIKAVDMYGIVTHHGKSFSVYPISSYYHELPLKRVRCLGESYFITEIQFGGTGCMGFHTSFFKPKFNIFKRKNMADIWVGLEADRLGKKIYALPHYEGYIIYQPVEDNIWNDEHRNDSFQVNVINNYFLNEKIIV